MLSIYGCYKHHHKVDGERIAYLEVEGDVEKGTLHTSGSPKFTNAATSTKESACNGQDREIAGVCGYVFQVIFQVNFLKLHTNKLH